MDARSILLAQIQASLEELGEITDALQGPQIDPNLRDRVKARLTRIVKRQSEDLKTFSAEVTADQPLKECWLKFEQGRKDRSELARESLAMLQGSLARTAGLDKGLCSIADAMLDELAAADKADVPWGRFTIIADSEFYTGMAEIIRLRFPEVSIWNLPIAAHEFGHFVGPALKMADANGSTVHPFEKMLQEERTKRPEFWHYLHEHFADVFATYTMGPAFAYTCIYLRFNPQGAYDSSSTHPSAAKRVYLILKTLEKMNGPDGAIFQPYKDKIQEMTTFWMQSLVAVGELDSLAPALTNQLDTQHEQIYKLVTDYMPDAQYKSWLRALQLIDQLQPTNNKAPVSQPGDRIPDVLNAAWLCRIQHWQEGPYVAYRIGERAVDLCRQLI